MTSSCLLIAVALTLGTVTALGLSFPEFASPQIRFVLAHGLGPEPGVCRRDPSDIIRVAGTYYVWYTKVLKKGGVYSYPSGYSGTIWYATSKDGYHWVERGQALGPGKRGSFDDYGVFTPGILVAGDRYYLFYTAVRAPMSESTPTAIGVAVARSPDGPWTKLPQNPVLVPSEDPQQFDSFRVDDSCLLIRNGQYWLYYKGRQQGRSPRETKWGVAIAERPEGPYVKHPENPVTSSGHEVLVWPHREGVAALIGPTGPEKNTIQYAPDGIHFRVVARIENPPRAPGGYRLDAFTGSKFGRGMPWGISMVHGPDPYLVRFECGFVVQPLAYLVELLRSPRP